MLPPDYDDRDHWSKDDAYDPFAVWVSKDGTRTPVEQMRNGHVLNAVNFVQRKLFENLRDKGLLPSTFDEFYEIVDGLGGWRARLLQELHDRDTNGEFDDPWAVAKKELKFLWDHKRTGGY